MALELQDLPRSAAFWHAGLLRLLVPRLTADGWFLEKHCLMKTGHHHYPDGKKEPWTKETALQALPVVSCCFTQ